MESDSERLARIRAELAVFYEVDNCDPYAMAEDMKWLCDRIASLTDEQETPQPEGDEQ